LAESHASFCHLLPIHGCELWKDLWPLVALQLHQCGTGADDFGQAAAAQIAELEIEPREIRDPPELAPEIVEFGSQRLGSAHCRQRAGFGIPIVVET
jgi:hypothetical protein